jgi:hypothetical protein
MGFICECLNQLSGKAVDAPIFTKQADDNCFLEQERSVDG